MLEKDTVRNLVIVLGVLIVIGVGMYIYILQTTETENQYKYMGSTVPLEVSIVNSQEGCFNVDWNTKERTIGYVKYGTDGENINMIQKTKEGMIFGNEHEVQVCNLEKGKKYFVVVVSEGVSYGKDGEPLTIEI
jgi:hypothetical protein